MMNMDTYRVQLPQPQAVINEEDFVTNSGRKAKQDPSANMEVTRDNTFLTPDVSKNDMLASGVSVLSQEGHGEEEIKDKDLSDSVQAELHLSLDRLSENFDPEELKRLQEKSKTHREKLSSVRDGPGKTPDSKQSKREATSEKETPKLGGIFDCVCKAPLTGDAEEMKQKNISAISRDSLDTNTKFQSETDISAESDQCDDDEDTLVGDFLDYLERDSLTSTSTDKIRNRKVPTPLRSQEPAVDKYADLRYDPNRVERNTSVKPTPPIPAVVDLTKGHDLSSLNPDSLNEASNPRKGAIAIHHRDMFSPVTGEHRFDEFQFVSSRSISPTRLSVDPVKLKQTNEIYEAEFHRLMQAESDSTAERRAAAAAFDGRSLGVAEISGDVRQRANDGILVRRIESDMRSPVTDPEPLLGGYVALPNRHMILSPGHDDRRINSEDVGERPLFNSPNSTSGRRRIRHPEDFITNNKKDPLNALSPRTRTHPVGPTPPRAPKPKNHKDYIEMNKQRIGRKTNSAGYLELHNKRLRQNDQPKSRSYSELRKTSENAGRSPQREGKLEEVTGSIEDIWQQKTERLKIAKGENVNKGKIARPPKARSHDVIQGNTFLVSPRAQVNWNRMHADAQNQFPSEEQIKFFSQDNLEKPGGLFSRLHQRNNREVFYEASHRSQALPLPSQQHFFNPHAHPNGEVTSHEELVDSFREEQMRRAIMVAQYSQQQSPLMKAYHAQYGQEPVQRVRSMDEQVHPYFSEQNMSLPPSQRPHQPEIWVNTDLNQGIPSSLPPSHPSSTSKNAGRKVTFLGDNEAVFMAEDARLYQVPVANGGNQGFGKHKVPLPPTPLNKSHTREVHQGQYEHLPGKENISLEDYYNARQGTYPILPPILKTQQKSPLKSSPVANEKPSDEENRGGYLENHEKQKRKRQYKIYTLTDYKNLKKDVKLGGLGPDLGSVKDKAEKQERARKYAEFIRNQHKSNAVVKERVNDTAEDTLESEGSFHNVNHHFSTRIDDKLRQELYEKRKRAIDYSKKVPRPKLKPKPSYQVPHSNSFIESPQSNRVSDDSLNTSPRGLEMTADDPDLNWSLLQVLKERHEREKAQVAAFGNI